MVFQAGFCSCPRLSARKVVQNHNASSRTARVIVRPGVHNSAAAAGDVALAGELAAVEQLPGQQQLHHLPAGQQHAQQAGHVLSQIDSAPSNSIVQLHNVNHSAPHASGHHGCWGSEQHSSSFAEAAASQLQLQLLPDEFGEQQLQQLDRLESNANASTSYTVSNSHGSGSSMRTTISNGTERRVDNSSGSSSSSNSSHSGSNGSSSSSSSSISSPESKSHTSAGGTHVHRSQQRHGLQDRRATTGSSGSTGSSSSSSLTGLQLVRPSGGRAVAGARACSPAQLAALSDALRVRVPDMQKLLDRHPQLVAQPPAAVQAAVQQLATALSLHYDAAAYMCYCYPVQLLLQPVEVVTQSAAQLAQQLQLPTAAPVTAAAAAAPGLLARPQAALLRRLRCISTWFHVSHSDALKMVASAPELLTDSGPSIQKRAHAIGSILRLQPVCVQRMVAACPRVLFMSPRIMNNKVKVLMAIMHKNAHIIGRDIVYKTPQLLQRNLEKVRICYQLLPVALQRHEGFAFAMAAHNGRLLLLPAAKLLVRGARLQAALELVPEWQQQWQQLRPPQVEQGFAANYSRFERLEFLVSTQQASSIDLLTALKLCNEAFEQQYSSWGSWWQLKLQRVQQQQWQLLQGQLQRPQKGQERGQSSQLQHQHQQQQQQQQCGSSSFAVGPQLHPGPQQQQQLQLQYQHLVHQQLRRMQHLHRQRQLQLQQHRALVLQQRALQWQQLQKQKHLQQQQIMRLQQQRMALQVQGMQLQEIAGVQQQQQNMAEGSYLWGRHAQPLAQQQQQQSERRVGMEQRQQQLDEQLGMQQLEHGRMQSAAELETSSRSHVATEHAGQCAADLAAAAAAASGELGTNSSTSSSSWDAVRTSADSPMWHQLQHQQQQLEQQQPVLIAEQSIGGQLSRISPRPASSSSSSSGIIDAEDMLVTPQQQQQQQRAASYMLGARGNANGRAGRSQQPCMPQQQQQQSQQVLQPAAATARLGSV